MRQWRPEGKPANCCLPRTLRNVEDYFSASQWRVIEAMTTKGPRVYITEKSDKSWECAMSYGKLAAQARVCVKTVRNAIAKARALGLILRLRVLEDKGQRTGTVYVIRPFAKFLADIRANPAYFHTAEGH